jgi:hypothetical protein
MFIHSSILKLKAMTTIKKKSRYRRADNGEYTTRKFAERNPSTTVKETDKQSTRHKRKRH